MALRQTIVETLSGAISGNGWSKPIRSQQAFPDCYIKIEKIHGTKERIGLEVSFTSTTDESKTQSYVFEPVLDGDNFIKQGYKYLKTLPDFAGAEDC